MSRLPTPGQDNGTWGIVLNDYLGVAHKVTGELLDGSVTTLALANAAITNIKLDVATQSAITKANSALQSVSKTDVGLSNVDNISDVNKPVSAATQTALNLKLNSTDLDSSTAALITGASSTTTVINSKIATATAGSTSIYILAPADPDPIAGSAAGLYFRRTS